MVSRLENVGIGLQVPKRRSQSSEKGVNQCDPPLLIVILVGYFCNQISVLTLSGNQTAAAAERTA
jgi:hypothetical protein